MFHTGFTSYRNNLHYIFNHLKNFNSLHRTGDRWIPHVLFFFLLCKKHLLLIGQGQKSPWLTNENYCGSLLAHQSRKISDTNGTTIWKEVRIEIHSQTSLVFSTVLPNQRFLLRLNTIIKQWLHRRDTSLSFPFDYFLMFVTLNLSLLQVESSLRNLMLLSNGISLYVLFVSAAVLLQLLSDKIQSKSLLSSHLPVYTHSEFVDTSEISHQPSLFLSWIISVVYIWQPGEKQKPVLMPSLSEIHVLSQPLVRI